MQGDHAARPSAIDTGDAYERTRQAFVATVSDVSGDQLARPIPATSDWSVNNALGQVVGLAAGLNAQRFRPPEDIGGRAWTRSQVERARSWTVDQVIEAWDREFPTVDLIDWR